MRFRISCRARPDRADGRSRLRMACRQRAQRVNRVVVAEEQDGLASARSRACDAKVDLQTVSEIVAAMELSASAERFEFLREERGYAVDGWLVVAGRFDFHELARGFDNLALALFEVVQAIKPCATRCRHCYFLSGHTSLSLLFRLRLECDAVQYNLQAAWDERYSHEHD